MDFSPRMWRELPSNVWYHFKEGNVNYVMTIFSLGMHYLAIKGILAAPECKPETLLFAFLLWPLT